MNDCKFPQVSRSTRLALAASYQQDSVYTGTALVRMTEENPEVADFIAQFCSAIGDPRGAAECSILVYELLRNQAEAENFSFPDQR